MDLKKLEKAFSEISDEDIEKYFPKDTRPSGWISIEDDLPQMFAIDFINQGYSEFKVKFANGKEGTSWVCDHSVWYYEAKESGITHWWHEATN